MLVLQRPYRKRNGRIGFSRSGRSHSKHHIVLLIGIEQLLLSWCARSNGLARHTEDYHIAATLAVGLLTTQDVQHILLAERVVLMYMFLKPLDILLQRAHLQLITHNMYDIAACYDTQFGVQGFYYLHVCIVHPIQCHWVDVLNDYMLLYHPISLILLQIYYTNLSFTA